MKNPFAPLLLLSFALLVGCHSPGGQSFGRTLDRTFFTPTAWETNITSDATNVVPVAWKANAATVSTIQTVGNMIPGYGGIAGMAVTGLLGVVAHLRSRKFKAAAVSLIEGVNETISSLPPEHKQVAVDAQKTTQEDAGTRETIRTLLKAV